MALATGNIIQSVDVKNKFIELVKNKISSQINNAPKFSGEAEYGDGTTSQTLSNPDAVPASDLESVDIMPTGIPTVGQPISGVKLHRILTSTMSAMGRIRKYHSLWYHQVQEENVLKGEVSGIGSFKKSLPALDTSHISTETKWVRESTVWVTRGAPTPKVSGGKRVVFTGRRRLEDSWSSNLQLEYAIERPETNSVIFADTRAVLADQWTRNTNSGAVTLNVPGNTMPAGGIMKPGQVTQLIDSIYNAWNTAKENRVEYVHYTCHSNCHGSCHGSRGRR